MDFDREYPMTRDPYERAIWETRELREMDAEEEAYSELLSPARRERLAYSLSISWRFSDPTAGGTIRSSNESEPS